MEHKLASSMAIPDEMMKGVYGVDYAVNTGVAGGGTFTEAKLLEAMEQLQKRKPADLGRFGEIYTSVGARTHRVGSLLGGTSPDRPLIYRTQHTNAPHPRRGFTIEAVGERISVIVHMGGYTYHGSIHGSKYSHATEFIGELLTMIPASELDTDLISRVAVATATAVEVKKHRDAAGTSPNFFVDQLFVSGYLSGQPQVARVDTSLPLTDEQSRTILMLAAKLVHGNTLRYAVEHGLADRLLPVTVEQHWSE